MRSNDIANVIDKFVLDERLHAILIDGPWGSGKTYQIKNFLSKKQKDDKFFYVSLFGSESIDEINTTLYNLIHPNKVKSSKIVNTISRSIKVIPYVGGIGEALEYQLSSGSKQLKSKAVVIFDDLDRIGETISFNSLLGYFNQLILQKIKVVCLCSSNGIKEHLLPEFNKFKQKIFDRVFEISQSQEEVIESIFQKYTFNNIDNIISKFNKNIRMAQKTYLFFDEVMNYLSLHHYPFDRDINELELLGCCADIVNIVFKDNISAYKDLKSHVSYKYYEVVFGENIAKGIQHLFEKKESFNVVSENKQKFYFALLKLFLFNDHVAIDKTFNLHDTSEENILDKSFYYLSDENKCIYIQEFINKSINDEVKLDEYYANMLFDILKYSDYVFEDDVRDLILSKIVKGVIKHKNRILYFAHVFGQLKVRVYDKNRIEHVKVWDKRLKELYVEYKVDGILEQLEEFKDDYSELFYVIEDIIRDEELLLSSEIREYIVENNYLLPDLSGDTDQQSWSFAHIIANYCKLVGLENDFIENIVCICNSSNNNISLIDRYDAIVRHKIDQNIRIKNMVNNKKGKSD